MLVTVLLYCFFIRAEEIVPQPQESLPQEIALPCCVDNPAQVQKLLKHVQANKNNSSKYAEYSAVLRGESDAHLLARLAYAETLAANCPALNSSVGPRIVEVIANRVRRRGGDVRSVVFQRDQFASSLNIYSNSRYRDFLCPRDLSLWKEMMTAARVALQNPPSRLQPDTMNYFLYKHDRRWTKEPWSLKEDSAGQADDARACIRFFRVPHWK